MYIHGAAVSLHPGSGLSRGKVLFFATLAGAQKEAATELADARDRPSLRSEALLIRLSPEEHQSIRSRAEDCGKPTSTYMREVALGTVPRARPRRLEQEAVYQLGRIGNNLNQLAYVANATGRLDTERRLHEVLDELLEAVRRIA